MLLILFILGLAIAHVSRASEPAQTKRPNVVVFIMDDVGMGDLGCFGNDTIRTPNIDALAAEGAKLTQHIALPLCTPSRAALMTGRYPVRYGMASKHIMRVAPFLSAACGMPHNETTYAELLQEAGYNTALIGMASRNIIRIVPFLSSKVGMPPNETTYAEMLKDAGYATALVGKWHLGTHCETDGCQDPIGQGFDYYYGVPLTNLRDCRGDSNVFIAWDEHIYRDIFITYVFLLWGSYSLKKRNIVGRPGFFILFAIASLACGGFYAFIQGIKMMNCLILENRKVVEQPFSYDNLASRMTQRAINFLEVNHNKPLMLTMSFLQAHTALFSSDKFANQSKHGPYGDTVEEMDFSLGEVMSALKRLGIDNNTFVYLTSDNGGHVEEHTEDLVREGGWNGIYKGSKGSSYEGGIRVPTVVRYPGIVPAGIEISEPTHVIDALPTIANVVGIPLPEDRIIDGRDMMPLLTEQQTISDHEFLYHYCGGYMHGVRYRPRKGSVSSYKVVYSSVRLVPGPHGVQGCFNTYACQCYGSSIDHHSPPLVYDITNDPSESTPLDHKDPLVQDVIARVEAAIGQHKASLSHVPYQFSFLRMMPRPWAQPCCGVFPFCSCKEPSYSCKEPSYSDASACLSQEGPQPELSSHVAEEQITPQT